MAGILFIFGNRFLVFFTILRGLGACGRSIFNDSGVLLALWGHLGSNGHPDLQKNKNSKKVTSILTPFGGHFEVLGASKIASDFRCFFKGFFQRFLAYLGSQRAFQRMPLAAILKHFGATSGNVKTMLPCSGGLILEEAGGPERPQLHHFGHICFACVLIGTCCRN